MLVERTSVDHSDSLQSIVFGEYRISAGLVDKYLAESLGLPDIPNGSQFRELVGLVEQGGKVVGWTVIPRDVGIEPESTRIDWSARLEFVRKQFVADLLDIP